MIESLKHPFLLMRKASPPLFNQTYIDTGEGPCVVLLHGLFGNLGMWRPLIEDLKGEYRVIVPRLPVFDLPIENTNIKFLAKILHDYLDWHQITDVTLVGHAIGGQVALMYTNLHPFNVRKLVLTGSSGLFENSPFLEADASRDFSTVDEKVREVFFDQTFVPGQLIKEVYDTVQDAPKRIALGELARSSRQSKVSPFLGKVSHPVLLVWGLNDLITPPEVALHFHDLLPNSELKFISKCGHLPMVEQAGAFNKHLMDFLSAS
jgi:2-hydroxy-6-oxonona-2,4-dienedioate hydrolase